MKFYVIKNPDRTYKTRYYPYRTDKLEKARKYNRRCDATQSKSKDQDVVQIEIKNCVISDSCGVYTKTF